MPEAPASPLENRRSLLLAGEGAPPSREVTELRETLDVLAEANRTEEERTALAQGKILRGSNPYKRAFWEAEGRDPKAREEGLGLIGQLERLRGE